MFKKLRSKFLYSILKDKLHRIDSMDEHEIEDFYTECAIMFETSTDKERTKIDKIMEKIQKHSKGVL